MAINNLNVRSLELLASVLQELVVHVQLQIKLLVKHSKPLIRKYATGLSLPTEMVARLR